VVQTSEIQPRHCRLSRKGQETNVTYDTACTNAMHDSSDPIS
jgi:hypothetical protein